MERCEICGRRPAKKMSFSAHQGLLIVAKNTTISGVFCRDHALAAYRASKGVSLKGMWFSPHSLLFGTVGAVIDSAKLLDLPAPVKDEPGVSHNVDCPSCGASFFEPAGPVSCGKCRCKFAIVSCGHCGWVQALAGARPVDMTLTCKTCGAVTRGPDCVRNWIYLLLPRALAEVTAMVSKASGRSDEIKLESYSRVLEERYSSDPDLYAWLQQYIQRCLANDSLEVITACGLRFPHPIQDALAAMAYSVADSDGDIQEAEYKALRRVAILLGRNPESALGGWEAFKTARQREAWWTTLDVSPTVNPDELDKAYRDLARRFHPDLWNNAEEARRTAAEQTMKAVNQAYAQARSDVLDPSFRKRMAARANVERRREEQRAEEAQRDDYRMAAAAFESVVETKRDTLQNQSAHDVCDGIYPPQNPSDKPMPPPQARAEKDGRANLQSYCTDGFVAACLAVLGLIFLFALISWARDRNKGEAIQVAADNRVEATVSKAPLPDETATSQGKSTLNESEPAITGTDDIRNQDYLAVVPFITANMARADAVAKMIEILPDSVKMNSEVNQILRKSERVSDELRGFSPATALAVLLRPVGLTLSRTMATGGQSEFMISPAADETGPVGNPLPNAWGGSIPSLAQRMPRVSVEEQPLAVPLNAIQSRLRVPILLDHYALEQRGIRSSSMIVSFSGIDLSYDQTLTGLLRPAGLKYEARVDDLGTAFLWITTSPRPIGDIPHPSAGPKQRETRPGGFRRRFPPSAKQPE